MFNSKKIAAKKEVSQHIRTLKSRGWNYLGTTGSGHHKMSWPHAPKGEGYLRFSASPSDSRWVTNSQKDAQSIENKYPAPVETSQNTEKPLSNWDIRFKSDQEAAATKSSELQKLNELKQQDTNKPLSVQEKMRLVRQQLYEEKGI